MCTVPDCLLVVRRACCQLLLSICRAADCHTLTTAPLTATLLYRYVPCCGRRVTVLVCGVRADRGCNTCHRCLTWRCHGPKLWRNPTCSPSGATTCARSGSASPSLPSPRPACWQRCCRCCGRKRRSACSRSLGGEGRVRRKVRRCGHRPIACCLGSKSRRMAGSCTIQKRSANASYVPCRSHRVLVRRVDAVVVLVVATLCRRRTQPSTERSA